MQNVLVINCGSSSLKYQLLDMTRERLLAKGLVERIGLSDAVHSCRREGRDDLREELPIPDHGRALELLLAALTDGEQGVVGSLAEVSAVGHRVVHAGEKFSGSVIIDEDMLETVWGYEAFPSTRTIDNFILRLRKRFERDPAQPEFFHTIRGVGYRFTPDPEKKSET